MKHSIIWGFVLAWTFCFAPESHARIASTAPRPAASELVARARSLLDAPDIAAPEDTPERFLGDFLALECSPYDVAAAELKILDERRKEALEEYGVDLRASWTDNAWDSEDSHHFNEMTSRVGLIWDVIEDGYHDNHRSARDFERRRMREELDYPRLHMREQYSCRDTRMLQAFSTKRLALLTELDQLHTLWVEELRARYLRGEVYLDEVILAQEDQFKTRAEIESVRARSGVFGAGSASVTAPAPLVELDLNGVLAANADQARDDARKLQLEQETVREELDPFYDTDFEIFSDAGVRTDLMDSTSDMRVGMQIRIPLDDKDEEERVVDAELAALRLRLARERETQRLDIIRRYASYKEKLGDALRLVHRDRLTRERLRRALLAYSMASEDGGEGLGERLGLVVKQCIENLSVRLEMLGVKESLHRQMLYMLTQAGVQSPTGLVEFWKPPVAAARARFGERSAYIWSSAFADWPNERIIDFCRAKGISVLAVSAGQNTDPAKLGELLRLARDTAVRVELLFGVNRWIFPKHRDEALARVAGAARLGSGVHLDVEPHTLTGYKQNRAAYQQALVDLVRAVRERIGPDVPLSVSVTPRYTPETVAALAGVADRIYFMAYGVTEPERMLRLLAPFADIPTGAAVLALRPGDFPNELTLERFVDAVVKARPMRGVALHDFPAYVELTSKRTLR